jgi:hypothetical protein
MSNGGSQFNLKGMKKNQLIIDGIYRHKKGKLYQVKTLAIHSETLEEMVVYECLYENDLGKTWVRPLNMFLERFEYIGDQKGRTIL